MVGVVRPRSNVCLAPNAEERGQFKWFNGEILRTDLGASVGRGLVPAG